jgi:hypothetical protein
LSHELSETQFLGAAINGVVNALLNRDALLADFPRRHELAAIKNDAYHPLSLYIDFCNYLEARLGMYAFLRLGRKLGAAVMAASFPPELGTVEEAIAHINVAHKIFCRPVVGAFEPCERGPRMIELRYTAPYNCILQEGLFYEVAIRYGAANSTVNHVECRRRGAEACRYEIKY